MDGEVLRVIGPYGAAVLAYLLAKNNTRQQYLYDQKKNAYLRFLHAVTEVDRIRQLKGQPSAESLELKVSEEEMSKAILDLRFFGSEHIIKRGIALVLKFVEQKEAPSRATRGSLMFDISAMRKESMLDLGLPNTPARSLVFWKRRRTPRPLHPFAPKGSEKSYNTTERKRLT